MNEEAVLDVIDQATREGWTRLNLSNKGLQILPAEIGRLVNLQWLDLSNNLIASLPSELGQLSNLQRLYLSRNCLNILPPEIGQLTRLERLRIADNQLNTLPPEFGQLARLWELYLYRNQFSTLPFEIIQLARLKRLDLSGNQLRSLPVEINRLIKLSYLNMMGNPLPIPLDILKKTDAPAEIIQAYIESVDPYRAFKKYDPSGDISGATININSRIFSLAEEYKSSSVLEAPKSKGMDEERILGVIEQAAREGWTELDLSLNGLDDLPPQIGMLNKLDKLILEANRLKFLPANIAYLINLTWLDLNNNQLSVPQDEIFRLKSLVTLGLSSNGIKTLPAEIGQLRKLTSLDISDNELSSLPKEIEHLTDLKVLYLQRNKITKLPKEFLKLSKLEYLDLSGNPMLRIKESENPRDPKKIIDACLREGIIEMDLLKVFLCHSSGDKPKVRELYQRLRQDGINPWLDEEELLPGQDWRLEIPKAVKEAHVVLVCLSKGSLTKEGYVQKEIKFALDAADEKPEGTIFLIPAKLEDCEVPSRLKGWQWVNLFEEGSYERLLKALGVRAKSLGLDGPRG